MVLFLLRLEVVLGESGFGRFSDCVKACGGAFRRVPCVGKSYGRYLDNMAGRDSNVTIIWIT